MSCRQLQIVDLSQTDVLEILGSTFAHCSQLQQLCLPRMLRTIEQEAFYKCTSLKEVSTPPSPLHCEACLCRLHASSNNPQARRGQGEGHMPSLMLLTNASTSTSPRGFESCRMMQTIFGEKTIWTQRQRPVMLPRQERSEGDVSSELSQVSVFER